MGNNESRGVRDDTEKALKDNNWELIEKYARDQGGLRTDELERLAQVYNSKRTGFKEKDFIGILECCNKTKSDEVLSRIVRQMLWRSVGTFLKVGDGPKNKDLRRRAVDEAMRNAEDSSSDLPDILPYCSDDQFDTVFSLAVEKGMWVVVVALLKRQKKLFTLTGYVYKSRANKSQLKLVLEKATQANVKAEDRDLSDVLTSCAVHLNFREDCFKQAVVRGLWNAVYDILKLMEKSNNTSNMWRLVTLGCSRVPRRDVDKWALKDVMERADASVIQRFLPLCRGLDNVGDLTRELVKRRFWSAATELFLLPQDEDTADSGDRQPLTGESLPEGSPNNRQPSNIFNNDDDRVDFIVKQSVQRGMWGVIKEMSKLQDCLSSEQIDWVTKEATMVAGMFGSSLDTSGRTDQLQSLLAFLDTPTSK